MRYLTILAVLILSGCDLLTMEANPPAGIELIPGDTLVLQGDEIKLELRTYDAEGNLLDIPKWQRAKWSSSDDDAVEVFQGSAYAESGKATITARLGPFQASSLIRVNPKLELKSSVAYVNQVAQDKEGRIQPIAGRDGVLRLFVTVTEQVHYYETAPSALIEVSSSGGSAEWVVEQEAPGLLTKVNESDLMYSYNLLIPGELIQPAMRIQVTYDPEDEIPGIAGSEVLMPSVVALPTFEQMFVPIVLRRHQDSSAIPWVERLADSAAMLNEAWILLPIGEGEVEIHEPYVSGINLQNNFARWSNLLNQMIALRELEGTGKHYYGFVKPPYQGGIVGIAPLGYPAGLGALNVETYAHEVGHTMGLWHAPCGGPQGADPNYPYNGGKIGIWGIDPGTMKLKAPRKFNDHMGYCNSNWVSDYHFEKALQHRIRYGAPSTSLKQPVLMVWGGEDESGIMLHPALQFEGFPNLDVGGTHLVEGFGPRGERVFGYRFTPDELPDGENLALINVVVPYDRTRDGPISSVTVTGPGAAATISEGMSPLAVFRSRSGQIRAIVDDWDGTRPPGMDVIVSTGLGEIR